MPEPSVVPYKSTAVINPNTELGCPGKCLSYPTDSAPSSVLFKGSVLKIQITQRIPELSRHMQGNMYQGGCFQRRSGDTLIHVGLVDEMGGC